jgi:hypothetical protein
MPSHVDAIAQAYVEQAGGDHERALKAAIADALADLTEVERRSVRAERLVSKGYVRGRLVRTKYWPESSDDAPVKAGR